MHDKKPIRIAHIVGRVALGGVDCAVMNYYRHIDRRRVRFDFLMDGCGETCIDFEILKMGGRVYKLEPYKSGIIKNMHQCVQILRRGNYDIVHSHLNTLSVFTLCAALLAGVPVRIAHSHSTASISEGLRAAAKYMLRPFSRLFATHYAACSGHAGRWLFGGSAVESGRVRIIPNAIDLSQYGYNPVVREKVRRELRLEGKTVIGHTGRFERQKNHDFLLDIFYEIKKLRPDAVLLLAGEGSLKDAMMKKARRIGIYESVLFLGARRDVGELLQAMDAFVFPSHFEGLGMAAVEAQCSGLRVWLSKAVPAETDITGQAEFISLSRSASYWADRIVSGLSLHERRDASGAAGDAGYEIGQAARELTGWYEEICQ